MPGWFARLVPFGRSATRAPQGSRVCFLGDGISGSWQMRAEQIAAARPGWTALATKNLTQADIDRHDLFCIVKRFHRETAERLRAAGKRVVYDVVDPWKQPEDGLRHSTRDAVIACFTALLRDLPVHGVIFPNRAMEGDLRHLVPLPTTIYHHHKPDLRPIRIRQRPEKVGYEGVPGYLGPWQSAIAHACHRHGLEFVVNPASLSEIDIGFAARGGAHGTLMATRYKSNVKLANFFAAGVPCVVHDAEASYHETDNGFVRFFRDEAGLQAALRDLLSFETRLEIHRSFLEHGRRFRIDGIVAQYEAYFAQVLCGSAGRRPLARAG